VPVSDTEHDHRMKRFFTAYLGASSAAALGFTLSGLVRAWPVSFPPRIDDLVPWLVFSAVLSLIYTLALGAVAWPLLLWGGFASRTAYGVVGALVAMGWVSIQFPNKGFLLNCAAAGMCAGLAFHSLFYPGSSLRMSARAAA
jgi:hypothetical protein